jgi:hypothetical protein
MGNKNAAIIMPKENASFAGPFLDVSLMNKMLEEGKGNLLEMAKSRSLFPWRREF